MHWVCGSGCEQLAERLLAFSPLQQSRHQVIIGFLPFIQIAETFSSVGQEGGGWLDEEFAALRSFSHFSQYTPLYLACSRQLDGTVASLLQLDNLQRLFQVRENILPPLLSAVVHCMWDEQNRDGGLSGKLQNPQRLFQSPGHQ